MSAAKEPGKKPARTIAKPRLRLIHGHVEEAEARAKELRKAGYRVEAGPLDGESYKALRKNPPDAFVISLERMPSQGRDIASGLRGSRTTRRVPIVFVAGEPERVARVRSLLPDATYCGWRSVRGALRAALARAASGHEPIRLESALAGYSGTPLPKKLGIREGHRVELIGAPADFDRTLGELPAGARLLRRGGAPADLTIWFVPRHAELVRRVRAVASAMGAGGLWILWQKKASGFATDVDEGEVRRVGLANGLVDYKICAVDARWSGLRFTKKKGSA